MTTRITVETGSRYDGSDHYKVEIEVEVEPGAEAEAAEALYSACDEALVRLNVQPERWQLAKIHRSGQVHRSGVGGLQAEVHLRRSEASRGSAT